MIIIFQVQTCPHPAKSEEEDGLVASTLTIQIHVECEVCIVRREKFFSAIYRSMYKMQMNTETVSPPHFCSSVFVLPVCKAPPPTKYLFIPQSLALPLSICKPHLDFSFKFSIFDSTINNIFISILTFLHAHLPSNYFISEEERRTGKNWLDWIKINLKW